MILTIVIFMGMFTAGAVGIPLLIMLLGPSLPLKGVFGKGMFILAQMAFGGTMAYYREDGTVALHPYSRDKNSIYVEDQWIELDAEPTIYRVGWADFIVDADPKGAGEGLVLPESIPATDGGARLLDERRGGYQLFSDVAPSDGIIIHWPRYVQQMGRQGNQMINRAKEIAMEKYGGGSTLSQTKFATLVLAATLVMFVSTFGLLLVM